QAADDGQELAVLRRFLEADSLGEGRFGADIDNLGTLRVEHHSAANGAVGCEADTFAIPGVWREVDDAHDSSPVVKGELYATDGKLSHSGFCRLTMPVQ